MQSSESKKGEKLDRKLTGRELMSKMMMNVKSKVRKGYNERLEAMTVKHSELEEDQKQKLTRLSSYDKFATLHKEMNHHSYTSQYYWVMFLLRRFILITVCIKSNDGYW